MLLAAEKDGVIRLLEAPNSKPGEQVFVEGVTPKTKEINYDEFASITITTKDNKAVYKNQVLRTKTEEISVDRPDNSKVR